MHNVQYGDNSALTRAQVMFSWVPVCPDTDARAIFVWVRTDVQAAIFPDEICLGKDYIGVSDMLG